MKIKKIKSQGEYCYPATIAAAVKDANFQKEDGTVMTQGEINQELKGPKYWVDVVFDYIGPSGIVVDDVNYTPNASDPSKKIEVGKLYTFKDFSRFATWATFSKLDIHYGRDITEPIAIDTYAGGLSCFPGYRDSSANVMTTLDVGKMTFVNSGGSRTEAYRFRNCISIDKLDLSMYDTTGVKDMREMFYNCRSLKNLYVGNFDTSLVIDMDSMFKGCESLTHIYGIDMWNLRNATNFQRLFEDCHSLVEITIPSSLVISSTVFAHMFYNCKSLRTITYDPETTPSGVLLTDSMFFGCESLSEIPFLSKFSEVCLYSPANMFDGCSALTSVDLSGCTTSDSLYFTDMFKGCASLSDITFGTGWGEGNYVYILDLCDCNSSGNYVLSANTWNSMLTMYDRKSAGSDLFIIRLNSKHITNSGSNVPENWKENMAARGYTISEVEA